MPHCRKPRSIRRQEQQTPLANQNEQKKIIQPTTIKTRVTLLQCINHAMHLVLEYMDLHKVVVTVDDVERLQDLQDMHYRKAIIAQAIRCIHAKRQLNRTLTFPTQDECIATCVELLEESDDEEEAQENNRMPFRKQIIREAILRKKKE